MFVENGRRQGRISRSTHKKRMGHFRAEQNNQNHRAPIIRLQPDVRPPPNERRAPPPDIRPPPNERRAPPPDIRPPPNERRAPPPDVRPPPNERRAPPPNILLPQDQQVPVDNFRA
eukprot:760998_1